MMTQSVVRRAACGAITLFFCATPLLAGGTDLDPIIQDQVIVRLRPGVDVNAFAADNNLSVVAARAIPSRSIYLFTTNTPDVDEEALAIALAGDAARVTWAEPNYTSDAPEGSARTFYFNRVNLPSWYQDQPALGQIGLLDASGSTSNGFGQTIAVIDTGIDAAHPAFDGVLAAGINLLGGGPPADVASGADTDQDGVVDEMTGHGTHVASLAEVVAPGAMILPIRALDSEGYSENYILAQGLFAAIDSGATVVNFSVGSTYMNRVLEDALEEALHGGVVIVGAAGNQDRAEPREYPAMEPDVLGIASVDIEGHRASFSNYHPMVDLVAPGVGVYGAVPAAGYAAWDGTSFSTPLVAGAAASIMSAHPEWGPGIHRAENVINLLRDEAVPVDSINPGYEGQLGAGMLNVDAALRMPVRLARGAQTSVSGGPELVESADFNLDGIADLAVGGRDVVVHYGDGAGGFAFTQTVSLPRSASDLLAHDFTGDGRPDIVVACDNDSVLLFAGVPGGFPDSTTLTSGGGTDTLARGDFDNDGRMDIAVVLSDAEQVRVLRNTGGGSFATAATMPTGARPEYVQAARLNGDAWADIVIVNRDSNNATIYLTNGPAQFALAVTIGTPADPRALALADMDGDGARDLIVGTGASGALAWYWNNGAGGFSAPVVVTFPEHRSVDAMAVADMSCDGREDIVVTCGSGLEGFVGVVLNRGTRRASGLLLWEAGAGPDDVSLADFDGDGVTDAVTMNTGASAIELHFNRSCPARADANCDGVVSPGDIRAFVTALTDPVEYGVTYQGCSILTADSNGDGAISVSDIAGFVAQIARN